MWEVVIKGLFIWLLGCLVAALIFGCTVVSCVHDAVNLTRDVGRALHRSANMPVDAGSYSDEGDGEVETPSTLTTRAGSGTAGPPATVTSKPQRGHRTRHRHHHRHRADDNNGQDGE